MTDKYRSGTVIKKGRSKGQRRCSEWVTHRLRLAQTSIFDRLYKASCRSSLCEERLVHAQADLKDAWKDLKAGECDKVLVTCEHLELIARKRD